MGHQQAYSLYNERIQFECIIKVGESKAGETKVVGESKVIGASKLNDKLSYDKI